MESLDAIDFKTCGIRVEQTPLGSVLWLTLRRPKVNNALDATMIYELHTIFKHLSYPDDLHKSIDEAHPRVLVLSGSEASFSSGIDIKVCSFAFSVDPNSQC